MKVPSHEITELTQDESEHVRNRSPHPEWDVKLAAGEQGEEHGSEGAISTRDGSPEKTE